MVEMVDTSDLNTDLVYFQYTKTNLSAMGETP